MIRKIAFTLLSLAFGVSAYAQSVRPPFAPIWANNAIPTTDILKPSDAFITAGWPLSSTPPSRQYFNWVLYRGTWGVDYLLHRGISDWDSATTYGPQDVVLSGGYWYQSSIASNVGNAPPGFANISSQWDIPHVPTAPSADASNRIASTIFVHNNYIPIGGAFSLLGGQIGQSQVPFAAIQQYQASLSINWSQITSAPLAVAATPNTVAVRDGSGHLFGNYLNLGEPFNENPVISQVQVSPPGDNYVRRAGFGYFQNSMNLANIGGQVTAGQVPAGAVTQFSPQIFNYNPLVSKTSPGCTQIPGGVTIMWGTMNPNGGTITVAFPCGGFSNAVFSVIANGTSAVTQSNVTSWNTANFTVHNTGGAGNYIAIGY